MLDRIDVLFIQRESTSLVFISNYLLGQTLIEVHDSISG